MRIKKLVSEKLQKAFEADPTIFCEKDKVNETLGSNPDYLKDVFGVTKSDLIRLEREGHAFKARYALKDSIRKVFSKDGVGIPVTGEHRVRWIIFKEVLNDLGV